MWAGAHGELSKSGCSGSVGHCLPIRHGLSVHVRRAGLLNLVVDVVIQDAVCSHGWVLMCCLEQRVHGAHDLDNLSRACQNTLQGSLTLPGDYLNELELLFSNSDICLDG